MPPLDHPEAKGEVCGDGEGKGGVCGDGEGKVEGGGGIPIGRLSFWSRVKEQLRAMDTHRCEGEGKVSDSAEAGLA